MAGTSFDDAVQELAQAPLPQYIAERKRLADTLKAAGDAKAAKALLARKRPPVSAWVVNQLYWHARDAFDDLLATAEKIRKGDLKASAAHRDVIAKLRARAKHILEDAGHAAPESTLRRVTTTLSAIAVAGGFDPDPPGALSEDRDPPGFAAFGLAAGDVATDEGDADGDAKHATHAKHARHTKAEHDEVTAARAKRDKEREREAEKAREAAAAAQRAEEMAEKKREEAEKKRVAAERHRLESALRDAKAELHDRERDVKQLEKQLAKAHEDVERAQEIVDDLARKLDDLGDGN